MYSPLVHPLKAILNRKQIEDDSAVDGAGPCSNVDVYGTKGQSINTIALSITRTSSIYGGALSIEEKT